MKEEEHSYASGLVAGFSLGNAESYFLSLLRWPCDVIGVRIDARDASLMIAVSLITCV
ncbi:MAG: hypothetical protein UZ21_OP11001000037 [Microgenomates bacterium OLB22]|nr:MAG: hypothetical protein UZ21_OP11001000037 [Microgenomates bacterium OLB22]